MAQPFIGGEEQQAPAPAAQPQGQQFVSGNPEDDLKRREAMDPAEVEEVTQEEQDQYDDFVARAIAMISDSRQPEGGGKSPSDAVLDVMNNSTFSIPQALAEGTVSTVKILHDAAKRQNVAYSPDVIFHGADEVIAGLYMLGSAAGIFNGGSDYSKSAGAQAAPAAQAAPQPMQSTAQAPTAQAAPAPAAPQGFGDQAMQPAAQPEPFAAQPTGIEPATEEMPVGTEPEMPSDGDFTDEEYAIMAEAKMLATELFGRKLQESGQLTEEDQKEAKAFWDQQIAKEVETGQVDDSMFDSMDIDSIRKQVISRGA